MVKKPSAISVQAESSLALVGNHMAFESGIPTWDVFGARDRENTYGSNGKTAYTVLNIYY